MEAVNLPRSRYLQVSNEAPAVKGGFATERSEAPLTAGGSEVARLALGAGDAPLPSCSPSSGVNLKGMPPRMDAHTAGHFLQYKNGLL
jgi:hypothetical protein